MESFSCLMQKGELNDTPTPVMSAQLLMDPRPSATFDANIEPSVSYDKTHEMLISPTNIMETKSQISGKRASIADSNIDQTSQSLGSPKSPRLEEEKPNEQVPEVPFRKARVSVRARSEAPLVSINFHGLKRKSIALLCCKIIII
jgi:hypothetical protein